MRDGRILIFQWAAGAFCFLAGTLMLIVPQQFSAPGYDALRSHLLWWGVLFGLAGLGMIWVAATAPARRITVAVHALAGGAFLLLAWGFAPVGLWRATVAYGTLGLGLLAAPFLPPQGGRREALARPDLFAVTMGVLQVGVGATLLLLPEQLYLDQIGYRLVHAAMMLLAGTTLLAGELVPGLPPRLRVASHLLSGAVLVSWMVVSTWPSKAWTAVVLFGGYGLLLVVAPWLGPRLRRGRPNSLRTQLSLAFAALAALPLIALTGLIVMQGTRELSRQIREDDRLLATAVAHNLDDYIGLHRAALAALAARPGTFGPDAEAGRERLEVFLATYPEIASVSLYDALGNGLLRSDGERPVPARGRPWFEEVRSTREATLEVDRSPVLGRPLFYIAQPALGADGALVGVAAATLEPLRLAELLAGSGVAAELYLVDETGDLLAYSDGRPLDVHDEAGATPPVAAFLRDGNGSLAYDLGADRRLVGFARAPGLGWGVIVERSQAQALAAVFRWRGASYLVLLVGILAAATVGVLIARRLSAPLRTLANAADALARGERPTPLPTSPTLELAQIATSFGRMRDRLTERTEELQRERDFSEELINSLPGLVFLVNRRGEVTHWNREVAELLAQEPDERLPVEPLRVIARADRRAAVATFDAVFRTGHASTECRIRTAGGALEPYHLIGRRLAIAGEPHVVGVAIDIGDRARAEEEVLRLNASLEERVRERTAELETSNRELAVANQELEAFLHSIAHDLRTPLRGIDGFAHVLAEEEGPRLGPVAADHLQRIRAGAARMGQLLDDLLSLSRLGRSPLRLRPVDVSALVEEVAAELRESEPERTVRVVVQPGLRAVADRALLRIVLENLLSNAWKCTRVRSEARIEVGGEPCSGVFAYYVRDDGIGFDPTYAGKLFAPFQRLHANPELDGTGIGLAMVQRIVHRHAGRVWAESVPGEGATFFFTLGVD